jgi:hypothetical protein
LRGRNKSIRFVESVVYIPCLKGIVIEVVKVNEIAADIVQEATIAEKTWGQSPKKIEKLGAVPKWLISSHLRRLADGMARCLW